jgi:hypothetical protein
VPDNDKPITLTHEQVCALAFQAAGAASVPFMRDHPETVMPTQEISELVGGVLSEHGIDLSKIHGYAGADA